MWHPHWHYTHLMSSVKCQSLKVRESRTKLISWFFAASLEAEPAFWGLFGVSSCKWRLFNVRFLHLWAERRWMWTWGLADLHVAASDTVLCIFSRCGNATVGTRSECISCFLSIGSESEMFADISCYENDLKQLHTERFYIWEKEIIALRVGEENFQYTSTGCFINVFCCYAAFWRKTSSWECCWSVLEQGPETCELEK